MTTAPRPRLILASASPRRLQLLEQIGVTPDQMIPSNIDETPQRLEAPRSLATRLAREKAEAAAKVLRARGEEANALILAADTVVAVGRRILPKPELVDEAAACLRLLSGRAHKVFTGICVITPKNVRRERLVETRVRFKRLSRDDFEAYLATGEWRGKAGGYAIQGKAGAFVLKVVGSPSNVVGLPLHETLNLLNGEGYPVHFNWLNSA
ncbi:septum formation protein [Rhizobiales bacterium GAS191]|nr:septum formation protein [Rhizobiales bacterium GAS191]